MSEHAGVAGMGRAAMRMGIAAPVLIVACTMVPESVTTEDIAFYDAAVASLGCAIVTEPDYLAAGMQTGLSRAQLLDITAYKLSSGEAERRPAGGIELTTGACA